MTHHGRRQRWTTKIPQHIQRADEIMSGIPHEDDGYFVDDAYFEDDGYFEEDRRIISDWRLIVGAFLSD